MPKPDPRWLTAQETAAILDSTSAEVCRLLKIGRLTGKLFVPQIGPMGRFQCEHCLPECYSY